MGNQILPETEMQYENRTVSSIKYNRDKCTIFAWYSKLINRLNFLPQVYLSGYVASSLNSTQSYTSGEFGLPDSFPSLVIVQVNNGILSLFTLCRFIHIAATATSTMTPTINAAMIVVSKANPLPNDKGRMELSAFRM
jgi:hypothetical protein